MEQLEIGMTNSGGYLLKYSQEGFDNMLLTIAESLKTTQ